MSRADLEGVVVQLVTKLEQLGVNTHEHMQVGGRWEGLWCGNPGFWLRAPSCSQPLLGFIPPSCFQPPFLFPALLLALSSQPPFLFSALLPALQLSALLLALSPCFRSEPPFLLATPSRSHALLSSPLASCLPHLASQVLSPVRRESMGASACTVSSFNTLLQPVMNPQSQDKEANGAPLAASANSGGSGGGGGGGGRTSLGRFRLHDRVVQLKNNYEKEVYNGDVGTVVELEFKQGMLVVRSGEHRRWRGKGVGTWGQQNWGASGI